MDWVLAVEKNEQALKRVLSGLIAMAGFCLRDAGLAGPTHLPRRLHRAVLRLLRPAESAMRRLVIVAARELVPAMRLRRSCALAPAEKTAPPQPAAPRKLAFPLFDRLHMPFRRPRPPMPGVPRLSVPGVTTPFPVRRPPAPDDPIDAARLVARLDALSRTLEDLPRQAERFARWQAFRDAERAQRKRKPDAERAQRKENPDAQRTQGKENPDAQRARDSRDLRFRRMVALRPGRPPGSRHRSKHEVHGLLAELHGLAVWALDRETSRPDTS